MKEKQTKLNVEFPGGVIRNCIVERSKDDKSEYMFLHEKNITKCWLDGYIIMPMSYLDNIFKWMKGYFRYRKRNLHLIKVAELKKIKKEYKK